MTIVRIDGEDYTAANFSTLKLAQRQAKIYALLDKLKTAQNENWKSYNAAVNGKNQQDQNKRCSKTQSKRHIRHLSCYGVKMIR